MASLLLLFYMKTYSLTMRLFCIVSKKYSVYADTFREKCSCTVLLSGTCVVRNPAEESFSPASKLNSGGFDLWKTEAYAFSI